MDWFKTLLKIWGTASVIITIYSSHQGDFFSRKQIKRNKVWVYLLGASSFFSLIIFFKEGFDRIIASNWGGFDEDGHWIPFSQTLSILISGFYLEGLYSREVLKKKISYFETQLEAETCDRKKADSEVRRLADIINESKEG